WVCFDIERPYVTCEPEPNWRGLSQHVPTDRRAVDPVSFEFDGRPQHYKAINGPVFPGLYDLNQPNWRLVLVQPRTEKLPIRRGACRRPPILIEKDIISLRRSGVLSKSCPDTERRAFGEQNYGFAP